MNASPYARRAQWSDPYNGVQHIGTFGTQSNWVTVTDYGSFAVLDCWFPGCRFSPEKSQHETAAIARQKGERWLRDRYSL